VYISHGLSLLGQCPGPILTANRVSALSDTLYLLEAALKKPARNRSEIAEKKDALEAEINLVPSWYRPRLYYRIRVKRRADPLSRLFYGKLAKGTRDKMKRLLRAGMSAQQAGRKHCPARVCFLTAGAPACQDVPGT
jgi:hypothetical protein